MLLCTRCAAEVWKTVTGIEYGSQLTSHPDGDFVSYNDPCWQQVADALKEKHFNKAPQQTNNAPVNDYICGHCGKGRDTKTEKNCWWCGNPIPSNT
jgi:uncharacterized protein YlaI